MQRYGLLPGSWPTAPGSWSRRRDLRVAQRTPGEPPKSYRFPLKREDRAINPYRAYGIAQHPLHPGPDRAPPGHRRRRSVTAHFRTFPPPLSFLEHLYEYRAMAITDRGTATLALAHALFAAEQGLPVIPLSPSKLPALPSPHRHDIEPMRCRGECGLPGHGIHDATTDPAGVRALFAAAPWAMGYGIACGRPPHHLIGIDLDVKPPQARPNVRALNDPAPNDSASKGETDHPSAPSNDLDAIPSGATDTTDPGGRNHALGATGPIAERGAVEGTEEMNSRTTSLASLHHLALRHLFTIPETITVLTPSGGRHLWLTGPPDVVVPNSVGRLAPGIDVRGAGGYLVGPGSVSHQGLYRLAPGTAKLAPAKCPRALLRLIAPPVRARQPAPTPSGARPERGQGLVQFVLAAHEGQRNTRLFWAACRAYENGIGTALVNALVHAAVHTGLTEREARATIDSAARLTSHPVR